jgi:RNA polymerase sigma factor (TIGR02999 family)
MVENVTQLLRAAAGGGREELDALLAAVYEDLRVLARRHLAGERAGHTLQPTALVHEAYLRLVDRTSADWSDRVHFFAVASQAFRRILVDHARTRKRRKRGAGRTRLTLHEADAATPRTDVDLLALDEALRLLADIDARQARIVELRYFGGLSIDEVAQVLGMSPRGVDREWSCAKAWLYRQLQDDEGRPAPRSPAP